MHRLKMYRKEGVGGTSLFSLRANRSTSTRNSVGGQITQLHSRQTQERRMRETAKYFTFFEEGGTCSLSADQRHKRISHGRDRDGEDDPHIVLGVVEILN